MCKVSGNWNQKLGKRDKIFQMIVCIQVLKQQIGYQSKISILWVCFKKADLQFHRKEDCEVFSKTCHFEKEKKNLCFTSYTVKWKSVCFTKWFVWLKGLVWLNGWVFTYKLSGCGFKSQCSHLKRMLSSYHHQAQCTVLQKMIKSSNHRFSSFMTLLKVVQTS